jgi:release factor glutamine methyltransferase
VTLQEWLLDLRDRLSRVPSDDTMRDIRILAAHAMGVSPSRMTLHMHDELSDDMVKHISLLVDARMLCTPVSKIIQKRSFWGREFAVDLDVLDPRPDTETLIAAALDLGAQSRVLDLGTGTGIIGLTLAAEWPNAEVVCTDISEKALAVANHNKNALGVADKVTLLKSDWFEAVNGQFDLILSNPPYIALDEWDDLDFEVRTFDPRLALTDEADGLSAYRTLTQHAGLHLKTDGHLMVEIGHTQGSAVQALFNSARFIQIKCLPDMAGRDRVVKGVWSTQ